MKKFISISLPALITLINISFRGAAPLTAHHSRFTTYRSLPGDTILYPEEKHFKNIQQLTFGGDNAEAYFSFDSK